MKGWLISEISDGGGESVGQLKLEISESVIITAARACRLRGLCFFAASRKCGAGQGVQIVSRVEPVGEMLRIWTFMITPSSERVAL